ncbi:MAG TPA: class II glutamine amidotransferase [Candidatus Micrarchaeia archaeon]|nr:class II glutamine amidotransferase [Candidatus Micrarchaeia archaeon]
MCELLAVAFPEPQPFERVHPWALALERLGVAGFGWGVAWIADGAVAGYRSPGRLADDRLGADRVLRVRSSRFLVHLRRPSQLSTTGLADSQPFVSTAEALAFAHNGRFERAEALRPRFAARLLGRADSEVGFQLFAELCRGGTAPAAALADAHRQLGGPANLVALTGDGSCVVHAGNPGNDVWQFRLQDATVASTALHSADEALFTLCLPGARERRRIAGGSTLADPLSAGRAAPPGRSQSTALRR